MNSGADTPKGWVAPFGHLGIKACSRLPQDFRSVPRPSSPPGAKASTRCPSLTQTHSSASRRRSLAQDPSNHWPVTRNRRPGRNPPTTAPHQPTPNAIPYTHFFTLERAKTPPRQPPNVGSRRPPVPTTELPRAPKDATEPDSQSPKNIPAANGQWPVASTSCRQVTRPRPENTAPSGHAP
jgi:hypothetical protein